MLKTGPGTMVVDAAGGMRGQITLAQGSLIVAGGMPGISQAPGTNLTFSTANRQVNLTTGALQSGGTVTIVGAGNLRFGGAGTVGASYTIYMMRGSLMDIQGSTVQNDNGRGYWMGNLGSINLANGASLDTWDVTSGFTMDALNGQGTITHTNYNGTVNTPVVVGIADGSGSYDGTLTDANTDGGSGGGIHNIYLAKTGTGTQTLSALNGSLSYHGPTVIQNGTLALTANATSIANTPFITIFPGATLDMSGLSSPFTLGGGFAQRLNGGIPSAPTTIKGSLSVGSSGILATLGASTLTGNLTLATADAALAPALVSTSTTSFTVNGASGVTLSSGTATIAPLFVQDGTYTVLSAEWDQLQRRRLRPRRVSPDNHLPWRHCHERHTHE